MLERRARPSRRRLRHERQRGLRGRVRAARELFLRVRAGLVMPPPRTPVILRRGGCCAPNIHHHRVRSRSSGNGRRPRRQRRRASVCEGVFTLPDGDVYAAAWLSTAARRAERSPAEHGPAPGRAGPSDPSTPRARPAEIPATPRSRCCPEPKAPPPAVIGCPRMSPAGHDAGLRPTHRTSAAFAPWSLPDAP